MLMENKTYLSVVLYNFAIIVIFGLITSRLGLTIIFP